MIYLVRHGQTDWNTAGKVQGHTDIPLNETGRQQALELKEKFSDMKFDLVFSSPLSRAAETAKIISGSENIITDYRLIEKCNGIFEDMALDEIRKLKESACSDYDREYLKFGVEARAAIHGRARSFLDEMKALYPGKNILVVTHGAAIISFRCITEGEPADGDYGALLPGNCEYIVVEN